MKNELQNLTEDISRLYEEITQKTESLGQIDSITRLYDELTNAVAGYLDRRGRSPPNTDQVDVGTDGRNQQEPWRQ